eukprot:COSAG05_NODE_530_length_8907_cov_8.972298_2_plen_41_part_00
MRTQVHAYPGDRYPTIHAIDVEDVYHSIYSTFLQILDINT